MQLSRLSRSDAGFTLIELIITIAILGILMPPLSNAIIGVLKNSDATAARVDGSRAAQIGATYFAQDVETLGKHDYTTSAAAPVKSILLSGESGSTCGTSGTTAVARFLSDSHDTTVSPTKLSSVVIAWGVVTVAGDSQLVRTRCVDGTVVSTITVARSLSGAPALTCSTTCNSATLPTAATLAFTVAPVSATPYSISLTGVRRQT